MDWGSHHWVSQYEMGKKHQKYSGFGKKEGGKDAERREGEMSGLLVSPRLGGPLMGDGQKLNSHRVERSAPSGGLEEERDKGGRPNRLAQRKGKIPRYLKQRTDGEKPGTATQGDKKGIKGGKTQKGAGRGLLRKSKLGSSRNVVGRNKSPVTRNITRKNFCQGVGEKEGARAREREGGKTGNLSCATVIQKEGGGLASEFGGGGQPREIKVGIVWKKYL